MHCSPAKAQSDGTRDGQEGFLCLGLGAFRQRPRPRRTHLLRRPDANRRCARRHPCFPGETPTAVEREVAQPAPSMDYEITPEEVKTKLDAGEKFVLLDVREPWEFETAWIEGARL